MLGLFITLEGIDGCGKSTQREMLAEQLKRRGFEIVVTREPGGSVIGEGIRQLLVSDASVHLASTTELLLYVAARAQHVAELIRPSVDAGRIVISDRYTDSTVAFQGYGRGLDLDVIERLNRFATGGLKPDLTIVFDLDPNTARSRSGSRPVGGLLGAFDEQHADFHARMRAGYLRMAQNEPSRIRVVDASGSADETHAQVMSVVLKKIEARV
ncbi:MAG TPA: dTMP kinase [Blastocatellia bacterium]|nr:dTMP kinase [Blastocatellia bacterium]